MLNEIKCHISHIKHGKPCIACLLSYVVKTRNVFKKKPEKTHSDPPPKKGYIFAIP